MTKKNGSVRNKAVVFLINISKKITTLQTIGRWERKSSRCALEPKIYELLSGTTGGATLNLCARVWRGSLHSIRTLVFLMH